MIGRAAELAELCELLAQAGSGRGRAAAVLGDPGIGKTTLVEELADRGAQDGYRVEWVCCSAGEGAPFAPWRRLTGAPSGVDGDARDRLIETTVDGLLARQPLLLVVEDAHWADDASLQLLSAVVAGLRGTRAMVVMTARDEPGGFTDLLATLPSGVLRQRLAGLAEPDVGRLVAAVLDHPSTVETVALISARTAGNPYFVREVARLIRGHGPGYATAIPPGVREVLERRLARLGQQAHRTLELAAVSELDPLDPALVAEAARVSRATVQAAFEEARVASLARLDPEGWRFAHALVGEVLRAGVAPADAAKLHQELAACLAGRHDADPAAVAGHWLRGPEGERGEQAAAWCLRAARAAARHLGFAEAVGWYRKALDADRLSDADTAEARLELGAAQLSAGDPVGSRQTFLAAAEAARRGQDAVGLARAALGLGGGVTGFEVPSSDATATSLLEEALAELPQDEALLRAAVQARLALALYRPPPQEQSPAIEARRLRLASGAVELATGTGSAEVTVAALAAYCDVLSGPDHVELRLDASERMGRLAADAGDRAGALLASRLRVVALLELGDLGGADLEIARYRTRADTYSLPRYRWFVGLWEGMRALVRGELDRARASAEATIAFGRDAGSANALMLGLTQLVGVHDVEGTLADFDASAGIELGWDSTELPMLHLAQGARAAVEHALSRVGRYGLAAWLPQDSEWLEIVWQYADAAIALSDVDLAKELLAALEPYSRLWAVDGIGAWVRGCVAYQLGRLAAFLGRPEQARAWLEQALAAHRAADATQLTAQTEAELAALLRAPAEAEAGTQAEAEAEAELARSGRLWTVVYRGRTVTLPDSKGLRDLAALLAAPGREQHVLDLVDPTGTVRPQATDAGTVIDASARSAYRRRLADLEEELAEAQAHADLGRVDRLRAEQEFLAAELAGALGLGGRLRPDQDPAERARKAVTMRIGTAIRAVAEVHPGLARHLKLAVSTGRYCVYRPEDPIRWRVTS